MRMNVKKNRAAFYKLPISLKSFKTDFKVRYTLFYKNILYKNIEAEIGAIFRIF